MSRIYGYVGIKLMSGILLSGCALSGLALISALIKKLGREGADLVMADILYDILSLLPYMVYEMLPLGCILGTTLILHSLAAHGELIIMRCLGISGWRFAIFVATPPFFLGIAAIFWVDYLAVPAYKTSATAYQNLWLEDERELLHIGDLSVPAHGWPRADDLTRFVFSHGKLASIVTGSQVICDAEVCRGEVRTRWGDAESLVVATDRLKYYGVSPRAQSLVSLWRTAREGAAYDTKAWQLWQRLSNPLFFAALALLMGVFVL